MSYVGWQAKIVRERKALLEHPNIVAFRSSEPLEDARKEVGPGWIRRLLGDDCISTIIVYDGGLAPDEFERLHHAATKLFPEANFDPPLRDWRRLSRILAEP